MRAIAFALVVVVSIFHVPPVCQPLADRYRIPHKVDRATADYLVSELDSHIKWPGVRQCRDAIRRIYGL